MLNIQRYQEIINKYFNNNYFAKDYLLSTHFTSQFEENLSTKFTTIKDLYKKLNPHISKEANLEKEFIEPIFVLLGFVPKYQTTRKIYGKKYQIDYLLFDTQIDKEKFSQEEHLEESTVKNALILSESKALGHKLDTKKIDFINNPHFQLVNYMQSLKHNLGFLTNGYLWRFYDLSDNRAEKVFCEIDLKSIIEENNLEAFNYFYHIFKKNNFKPDAIEKIKQYNAQAKQAVEEDLKDIIYGKNSIVSLIGNKIFLQNKEANTQEIFKNTLILTFRLLFIAYFEDKFNDTLFKDNKHYSKNSLKNIMEELIEEKEKEDFNTETHICGSLFTLFEILDTGSVPQKIPLLNGGLFNQNKASLLNADLFTNQELYQILTALLIGKNEEDIKINKYRDFKTLSIQHIGSIYEALLEFNFKIAQEKLTYLIIKKGKNIEEEGYFDLYDVEEFKKIYKKYTIEEVNYYNKGDIYLSNSSHNRKSTASYYTPKPFTAFMVKEAIDNQIENGVDLLDLKIIDNSCGSGHFLVEALNYVAKLALGQLSNPENNNTRILTLLNEEKSKIKQNIQKYRLKLEIDDFAVLKRTLLKKIIFGVDLNEFAIELTRLILWLDTFIFSTPLSFIEHHIKQGNALIGSKIEDLNKILPLENNLFTQEISNQINHLVNKLTQLNEISDTTPEEIEKSKAIYQNLTEDIEKLNLILNFTTYYKFYTVLGKNFKYTKPNIDNLNGKNAIEKIKSSPEYKDIMHLQNLYHFFNYEVEFATVFNHHDKGFNVVIGNPPWDKVKFAETDFFSQYRSNYRKLLVSQKAALRNNLLNYAGVAEEYQHQKQYTQTIGEVYKNIFPYNSGVGDSNTYTYFIEHNLKLLAKSGQLIYLIPSDIIYSDSTNSLRKHIFQNYCPNFFYQFENRKGLFKDVHNSYKFGVFSINNGPKKTNYIKTKFMQHHFSNLSHNNIIEYSYNLISKLSPNHHSLMEFKSPKDIPLMKKLYAQFSPLEPSYLDFRFGLGMTADNSLFKEAYQESYLPLYEGKMIHQFNNLFAKPTYYIDKTELIANQQSKELSRLINAIYSQIPQAKGNKLNCVLNHTIYNTKADLENIINYDFNFYKLVFRKIARNTDERSIIATLLPPNSINSESIHFSHTKTYILKNKEIQQLAVPITRLLFTCSILNSMVVDYIIRFIIDINLNKTYLMRLPLPQPSTPELEENPTYKTLYLNALKLILAHNPKEFSSLAKQFKITPKDIPTTQKQIDLLKIENDILVAKLYHLTYEEFKHLTSPAYFKTMHSKQPGYMNLLLTTAQEQLPKRS